MYVYIYLHFVYEFAFDTLWLFIYYSIYDKFCEIPNNI